MIAEAMRFTTHALLWSYLLWCRASSGIEYAFVSSRMSPADANAYCEANFNEGNLASIHSAAENAAALAVCQDIGQVQGACMIGLVTADGPFMDGSTIDNFANWAVGEPTNRDAQQRYAISSTDSGKWYNVKPERLPFLCQYTATTTTTTAEPIPDRLYPGEQICSGEYLLSANGEYMAVIQTDGNFVVYDLVPSTRALWHTSTYGNSEHRCMVFQAADGNFVMYNDAWTARWASYAYSTSPVFLVMQDDGNLVAYDTSYNAYWHTSTYQTSLATFLDMDIRDFELALKIVSFVLLIAFVACIALNIWLQCAKLYARSRHARKKKGYAVVDFAGDSSSDFEQQEAQQLKV